VGNAFLPTINLTNDHQTIQPLAGLDSFFVYVHGCVLVGKTALPILPFWIMAAVFCACEFEILLGWLSPTATCALNFNPHTTLSAVLGYDVFILRITQP
jgi:hypothetical protein